MDNKYVKIHTTGCNAPLKVTPGHFATNHAHINYYLDMTTLKTRLSEAQEIARSLSGLFLYDTVVDTIVCLEGTQVVGSFLAEELTSAGVLSMNAHKTIYIVTPEFNPAWASAGEASTSSVCSAAEARRNLTATKATAMF